jgi:hypothetical protein
LTGGIRTLERAGSIDGRPKDSHRQPFGDQRRFASAINLDGDVIGQKKLIVFLLDGIAKHEAGSDPFSRPEALAQSLLVKRAAFQHEREVRLLYFERSNVKHADGLYRCAIDPHDLIDQIMVDPRLSVDKANRLKGQIKKRTGFQGDIKRSLLYAPPSGFVVKIP